MKLRHISFLSALMLTLSSCAQTKFTALEQQQISVEDPTLFEQYEAFTVDFGAMRDKDYCFPLPVGKAQLAKDYLVEIETTKGDAVKAMFPGTVRLSRNNPSFGNVIVVRHDNGLETVYGNNAENLVKSGDRVKAGQTIAIVGTNQGRTYCLFSVMVNGSRINPETIVSLESHRLRKQTLGAKVISPYGRRGGRGHSGVDLKTKPDDEIRAAFDGEVVFSAKYAGYGNLVRILHGNGLETYYSHNSKNLVKVGDRVKAGDVIALTGRTGRATTEHLHFETRINGHAYDPSRFFDHQAHTIRMKAFQKTKNGYVVKK